MAEGPQGGAARRSDGPDPLIGRTIDGKYTVTSLIARGGMGKVYRAEQLPLGRLCALKVLYPNYAGEGDPEFHRRFFLEASVASKLSHPNTVTIFDYGVTSDDVYYMAMEYLEGQTLHQAIRQSAPFDDERTVHIVRQLCRALREAHALGVIHRDLKPANVFLVHHGDEADHVKVLDFGLVKHIGGRPDDQITQTGLFMGSPKYMAPEQIQGADVDARTDVYALGIMLYEMLCGKVPFDRNTSVNILMAHVGEAPPPMRHFHPNLACSPMLEDVVMRCIAKDPNERVSSMDELLVLLKQVSGVSATGQLPVWLSGERWGLGGAAGSSGGNAVGGALASGAVQALAAPADALATASQTPAPLERAAFDDPPPPRSRSSLLMAGAAAVLVGGLAGLVAFRMTTAPSSRAAASASGGAEVVGPSPTTSGAEAAPASGGSSPAPSASTGLRVVRVESSPSGAAVREDGVERCAATPCDVVLRGDDVEREHRYVLARAGYRQETRTVSSRESVVRVELSRAPETAEPTTHRGGGRPRGGSPAPAAGSAPSPTRDPAAPSGYKEMPY